MKIVLVQPPVQDFYDTDLRLQPLGLCYLKAIALQYHPDVNLIVKDYHTPFGRKTLRIPKELAYLKSYYSHEDKSPFSTFFNYYHFGADFDFIVNDLLKLNPQVIALSSLFTPYFREVTEITKQIKLIRPDIKILVGGSHVSALPQTVLSEFSIDFVITGEGELAFVEFIEMLKGQRSISDVSQLGYKVNSELFFNPARENYNLNDIPPPDLSDLNPEDYLFQGRPMTFMVTSRSCPHRCSFCSVHLTFGTRYRRRSVDSILSEINLRFKQGYRVIDFEDDNLTFFKKEFKLLCEKLIETYQNQEIQFVAMNGISYLSLDEELLILMKRAGFTHLNLALVSSDQTVRETTKRPHTIEKYIEVVRIAHQLQFQIVSYQILGLPNETLDSMTQTLIFNVGQPVLLGASMFYQTPNSPIAKNISTLSEQDHFKARLTAMAIETSHFKRESLYTLFILTRMLNFIKSFSFEGSGPFSLTKLINGIETLNQPLDSRSALGLELLMIWVQTGHFYMHTKKGRVLNTKFDSDLAHRTFKQIELIKTQSGQTIINDLFSRPEFSSIHL